MKYFISLFITIVIYSCNSELPADIHSAYWVENSTNNPTKINVLSLKKQKKGYVGTLYILEKNKKENSYDMKDIKINDRIIKFCVPELNMSFNGKISTDLFKLTGEFTTINNTKIKYSAEKTMDKNYEIFKKDFLNIE